MEARDFLTSAEELMQGNREIDYRNAASRAYYFAFHFCQESLGNLPHLQGNIGTTHQRFIADLLSYPDKKVQSLGNQLKHIKKVRYKADYKLNKKFYRHEASRLLSSAKKISTEVENLVVLLCA